MMSPSVKKLLRQLVVTALLCYGVSSCPSQAEELFGVEIVPGEVIVKFKEGTPSYLKELILEDALAGGAKQLDQKGLTHAQLSDDQSVLSAILSLAGEVDVDYVQPNFVYRTMAAPNDYFYHLQWGAKNTGQTLPNPSGTTGTHDYDMELEPAWDHHTDCSSVTVAVVDSGVFYLHEDLAANMWDGGPSYPKHGWDFVGGDNDPLDFNGHGTHVAGTIAGVGNNATGVAGVCWQASIMAVRVMDAEGSGNTATTTAGVNFAAANGAKIINMSIGGNGYDQAYYNAIEAAGTQGVLVVAGAGNEGVNNEVTPSYPCNYALDNIICVAALDQNYQRASYSNWGAVSVDIGAPGSNIASTYIGAKTLITPAMDTGWTTTGGWVYNSTYTSMVSQAGFPASYYPNNADARLWRTFNLSGSDRGELYYSVYHSLEANFDFLRVYAGPAASDPTPEIFLASYTGGTGIYFQDKVIQLPSYVLSGTTAVGFRLTSDASNTGYGVALRNVKVAAVTAQDDAYVYLGGTSMAAPHVAGLAALIMSYNPGYSLADVRESLLSGGETLAALAGITVTGKAANARGSLSYIKKPVGVGAVKGN